MKKSMAGIDNPKAITTDWLTPKWIIDALGKFDLDPCCPSVMPWRTAKKMVHVPDDGLLCDWAGRVWLNPPYSRAAEQWIAKLANHGNGIALVFARTETKWFHNCVWNRADGILFFRGRIEFCRPDGSGAGNCGGAPSCLVAYGVGNVSALVNSGINGKIIKRGTKYNG